MKTNQAKPYYGSQFRVVSSGFKVVLSRPPTLHLPSGILILLLLLLPTPPNLHGQTNGTVRFASRSLFAAEGFSGPLIGLIRSGGAASASVTVQVTGGTATEGVDFTISPKTVGFAPGVTNVGINLAVVADAPVEVLIRGPALDSPVSVSYYTESWVQQGNPAIPGRDYTQVQGRLTFAPGETNQIIRIPIINNNVLEGSQRMLKLVLSSPTGGPGLGRVPEMGIAITDNERFFYLDEFSAGERDGTITVNVHQQGDYDYTRSIHYLVAATNLSEQSGSATASLDFVPTEGTLTFGPGETNQSFTLTILDDSLSEGEENFYIVLDQPKGVGLPDWWFETSVTIRDDEPAVENMDLAVALARVDPDFKPDWPMPYSAVQPVDGKILVVTPAERVTGEDGLLVLRLLADGNLDPAWRAPIIDGAVTAVVPQTNGQVLIAAKGPPDPFTEYPWPEFHVNGVPRHHLARLNADGSLDTSFYALIMIDGAVTAMAVQPDGKILTGLSDVGGVEPTVLFRLNPEGSLDASFRQCVLWESFIWYPVKEVFLARDGGILVCTDYGLPFPLVRLNPDGSRDESFPAESSLRDHILSVAMQPDGRLLVQYWTNDSNGVVLLARLTLDGHFDPSFTPVSLGDIGYGGVFPAPDGKLWIRTGGPRGSSWLRRRNADGSEDTTWLPARLEMVWPGTGCSDKLLTLPDGNLLLPTYDSIMVNGHRRRGLTRLLVSAPLPRFEVDPASATVPENGGKVPIKLVRCGTNTEPITIAWQTEGGTAKPGLDYVPASGSLSFATNESGATLELELIDNAVPDEDRTVRLRLQGPPPDRHEYPVVEFTIANDDLGFPPGGIKRFPNGRVLLRTTGHPIPSATAPWGSPAYIETSEDLRQWNYADLGGGYPWIAFLTPETIDKSAPTNAARFYRLLRWPP